MPRGRPRTRRTEPDSPVEDSSDDDFDVANLVLEDVESPPKLKICSQFLTDNYYDMKKELKQEMSCAVCMDTLDCKNCFVLLSCGHFYHSKCLLFLREKVCPECRDHD